MMWQRFVTGVCVGAFIGSSAVAQATTETPGISFPFQGQELTIAQAQRLDAIAAAKFYQLRDDCEQLCLAPDVAAEGVITITENEVIDFIINDVVDGTGLLIDSRMPDERALGFLPASANIPFSLVTPENPLLSDMLVALGARSMLGAVNFSDAFTLVVFDAGPTTTDASKLINALIEAGYPPEKIKYYRGGMQVWSTLGLTTQGTSL